MTVETISPLIKNYNRYNDLVESMKLIGNYNETAFAVYRKTADTLFEIITEFLVKNGETDKVELNSYRHITIKAAN